MGSLNSTLTSEQLVGGGAVIATVAVSAILYTVKPPTKQEADALQAKRSKKKKAKVGLAGSTMTTAGGGETTPPLLAAADIFDQHQDSTGVASATESKAGLKPPKTKKKKQKGSASHTPLSKSEDEKTPEPPTLASSSRGLKKTDKLSQSQLLDASWTTVRRGSEVDASTSSDAGVTTSATGDESPREEPKTLAEKLVPKPPKTQVDDLLPPDPGLARVMRITADKPTASGISWRDYEDAEEHQQSTDADTADDEGWGIVQGKRRTLRADPSDEPSSSAPETSYPSTLAASQLAKRQNYREGRKEANRFAKADAEADRLARLAKHKRGLEQARIEELSKKGGGGKASKISGGMRASVQDGHLVWE